MHATRIAICGLSSNVGKTTLLCDLLRLNPGWEAIKVSRGHYRSCGKSKETCCISPLLGDAPLILSGCSDTYAPGKDTGRYWEAGAGNVHWVICTGEQVEEGLNKALGMVKAEGVLIEGTSFLKCIPVDFSVMVVSPSSGDIKPSAAKVIAGVNAIYVSGAGRDDPIVDRLRARLLKRGHDITDLPVYDRGDLPGLAEKIKSIHRARQFSSIS
jgi:hypothetical protein